MKKFVVFLLTIYFTVNSVFAEKINSVKFNGNEYSLVSSEKSSEHSGYYNQYFKSGENFSSWTDFITVQHFPNMYSPVDLAHAYREFLGSHNCPSSLWEDESKNIAMLDFLLIDSEKDSKLPIIIEFNVFRYEKSSNCGTVAFQYAKRYTIQNMEQVEKVKKEFEKFRPKVLKKVLDFESPDVISTKI